MVCVQHRPCPSTKEGSSKELFKGLFRNTVVKDGYLNISNHNILHHYKVKLICHTVLNAETN